MHLRLVLIAMGIGVIAELVARVLRLWLFRHWSLAVVNIVVVFGFIMGSLAAESRALGSSGQFVAAAVVGCAVEIGNLWFLHFWRFPDGRADTLGSRFAVIFVLTILWGLVPMATLRAYGGLQESFFPRHQGTPMEQINEREQHLLRKLDELRNRTRDVENRLDVVRQRKERLLKKPEAQHPMARDAPGEEKSR